MFALIEPPERCSDPRHLDYASSQTMPGIQVIQVDQDGMVEDSAADALGGSPNKWLTVAADHGPFTVRVKVNEPCPMWEIVSFRLVVKGVFSFYVRVGDQTSDTVQV